MSDDRKPWSGRHPGELLTLRVDGDLSGEERRRVEEHLEGCGRCRALASQLEEIAERARRLPDRPPEADLWTGIAEEITGSVPAAGSPSERSAPDGTVADGSPPAGRARRGGVGDGDEAEEGPRPEGIVPLLARPVRISVLRLAAAAVLVAAVASGVTWSVVADRGGGAPDRGATLAVGDDVGGPGRTTVHAAAATPRGVVELEARYREARDELEPDTRRMLDRNLRVIDRAIAEARRVLAEQPDNRYAQRHLAETMRRKAEFLNLAVGLAPTG